MTKVSTETLEVCIHTFLANICYTILKTDIKKTDIQTGREFRLISHIQTFITSVTFRKSL